MPFIIFVTNKNYIPDKRTGKLIRTKHYYGFYALFRYIR